MKLIDLEVSVGFYSFRRVNLMNRVGYSSENYSFIFWKNVPSEELFGFLFPFLRVNTGGDRSMDVFVSR